MAKPMPKTEEEWKKILTPEQYKVMREKGTEPPFTGKYYQTKDKGVYKCAACGNELFSSDTKFESSEPGLKGWPSFDQAIPGAVKFQEDKSGGMNRTEVVCAKCGSHLGHIFNAPDAKTGKHYCINSVCLELEKNNPF
jgi:peptide-methionine (R)-S-oxide reductase